MLHQIKQKESWWTKNKWIDGLSTKIPIHEFLYIPMFNSFHWCECKNGGYEISRDEHLIFTLSAIELN